MRPITALTGPNDFSKRTHLNKLLSSVPKDDVTVYFADEIDVKAILSDCAQSSLFGGDHWVIVKNIDQMSDKNFTAFEEALEVYLNEMNPDTKLVLLVEKFNADLTARIKEAGEVIDFKKLYREDLITEVGKKFIAIGVPYDMNLPDYLVDLASEDMDELEMMTNTLISALSKGKKLTVEDAKGLLSRSNTMDIFDFIEGIFQRDMLKASRALLDLRLAGETPIRINYMLSRTAKQLWGFLSLKDRSEAQTKLKIKYFEVKKLGDYARHTDLKFVSSIFELIQRVELKAKSISEDFVFLELENFIASTGVTR